MEGYQLVIGWWTGSLSRGVVSYFYMVGINNITINASNNYLLSLS